MNTFRQGMILIENHMMLLELQACSKLSTTNYRYMANMTSKGSCLNKTVVQISNGLMYIFEFYSAPTKNNPNRLTAGYLFTNLLQLLFALSHLASVAYGFHPKIRQIFVGSAFTELPQCLKEGAHTF